MSEFKYSRTINTKKIIKGSYADGVISNDEGDFDVIKELNDFNGADITLTIAEQTSEDLTE